MKVKKKKGEVENYRFVSLVFILGNKFELIFMDEFNDICGVVRFNSSELVRIY